MGLREYGSHQIFVTLTTELYEASLSDGSKKWYNMAHFPDKAEFSDDTLLSPEGRTQARSLHSRLPSAIDHVVLSTLPRTELTCIPGLKVQDVIYDDDEEGSLSGRYVLSDKSVVTWSKTPVSNCITIRRHLLIRSWRMNSQTSTVIMRNRSKSYLNISRTWLDPERSVSRFPSWTCSC